MADTLDRAHIFLDRAEREATFAGASFCDCRKRMVCAVGHIGQMHFSRLKLLSKVRRSTNGCWEWTGSKDGAGCGRTRIGDGHMSAHRAFYLMLRGPISIGLELDHLCRNIVCVNPDHLEPVSHSENMWRGKHATRTHCVNGHERTPENTYYNSRQRACRICTIAQQQAGRLRKKVSANDPEQLEVAA